MCFANQFYSLDEFEYFIPNIILINLARCVFQGQT